MIDTNLERNIIKACIALMICITGIMGVIFAEVLSPCISTDGNPLLGLILIMILVVLDIVMWFIVQDKLQKLII